MNSHYIAVCDDYLIVKGKVRPVLYKALELMLIPVSTPLASTWSHLNSDVGLEEGEY